MSQVYNPYPVDQLLHWAKQKPDDIWLIQPGPRVTQRYTWGQAAEQIGRMASALRARQWPAGSCVAISGLNSAHWLMADLAIQMAGLTPVGLYPRQAPQATTWILEHCDAKAVFMGPMPEGSEFVSAVPAGVLRVSLPYAGAPEGDTSWDVMIRSHLPLRRYERPAPETLATLVYTSGTTGEPKGVMLSYGNLAFTAAVFREVVPGRADERLFSYLPLAHVLERAAVEMASLYWGSSVFFLERIEKMAEQLPEAAPTRFFAVPLVLSRLQTGFTARIPEWRLRELVGRRFIGPLLRRRLLARVGLERTRAVFCAAAPVPEATLRFFRDVFGIDVLECYGQSEALYCSMNRPGAQRLGSVGKPFSDANLRLSAEGEIQVRHPGVMLGYYKEPERTADAFTPDGWLRTGDLGRFDADGFLYITGRIKDIFKTAKGKYVAPSPIEGALVGGNDDIDQLCLVGTHLTQPVMIVSLSRTALLKPRQVVEARLLADMERVNAPLEDHEKIAKLVLVKDRWTAEDGLLTPTLKVRRGDVEARYAEVVAREAQQREVLISWV